MPCSTPNGLVYDDDTLKSAIRSTCIVHSSSGPTIASICSDDAYLTIIHVEACD